MVDSDSPNEERLGLVVTRTSSPTAEATSNSVSMVMFALPPSILDWYGWPFRVSLPTSVCDNSALTLASRIAAPSFTSKASASARAARSVVLGREDDFVRGNRTNRIYLQHLRPITISEPDEPIIRDSRREGARHWFGSAMSGPAREAFS